MRNVITGLIGGLFPLLCLAADGGINVLPVPVVFYTPETGTGAGGGIYITYGDEPEITSAKAAESTKDLLVPFFVYTEKKQSVGRLYWDFWPVSNDIKISSVLSYTNYPDQFFGIGNDTRLEDAESYREVYSAADAEVEKRLARHVYGGLVLRHDEFQIRDTKPQGRLVQDNLTGNDTGTIRGMGAQVRSVKLDRSFGPRNGHNVLLRSIGYGSDLGSDFTFNLTSLEARYYIPIGDLDSLALEYVTHRASGDVPFRKLPMLGGQYSLRGFFLGRFRDNAKQIIQTEYRKAINVETSVNTFFASGVVGEDWAATLSNPWHTAAGVGLRYVVVKEDNLCLRLDLAGNKEETVVYFGAGEAF